MQVKVIGLQRSGTNYLEWIFTKCFTPGINDHELIRIKHGLPNEKYGKCTIIETLTQNKILPIVIFKNYGNWLRSIEKDPKNYYKMNRPNPHIFYWEFHNEWARHAILINYEEILKDFVSSVNKLGDIIGCKPMKYEEPKLVPYSPDWKDSDKLKYIN